MRSGPASAAMAPVRKSIWPSIYPRILELVLAHRSTIIFCNARRLAERMAARLNELAETEGVDVGEAGELVKAHHGSLAREQRVVIEDQLKRGALRGLVATSSLELGIDMGAVDLVIQVESPGAVSRGLQRIGRAGHQVGEPSRGLHLPQAPGRPARGRGRHAAHAGRASSSPPATCATRSTCWPSRSWPPARSEPCSVDDLAALVRRCAGFADLTDDVLVNVLDLLAGRYPSEEFGELRPRDRVGPGRRAAAGPGRRAAPGRHERRHHPRPWPVRRLPARRHPGGRARRGDGLREPARARRSCSARPPGGSRTSPSSGSS